jgi:trans-2,3-dihydro-3-hydroxyanthranilate isomerase
MVAAGARPLTYLFCTETADAANQVAVRFFFEAHGVREDPATGNGAAFLGAYLLTHRLLGPGPLDLRIEQGADVGRPSLVRLRARREGRRLVVSVGGAVLPVARGTLAPGVHGRAMAASPLSRPVR